MTDRRRRLFVAMAALAIGAAACSADVSGTAAGPTEGMTQVAVEANVVSDPSTGAVSVWSPSDGGPWPVVMLLHGLDGDRNDVEVLGRSLAAEGHTVFAPTWVLDADVQRQLTCAHRLSQTQADAYRGDASRPVSLVGHSAGASFAIGGSLFEIPIPADACFEPVPPPTVVVALAPCRFEEDLTGAVDRAPSIVVVSAEDDVVCPPEEQSDTVNRLVDAGIDATLVTVESADHWSVAFRALIEGQVVDDPSSADGQRAVAIIADAIAANGT